MAAKSTRCGLGFVVGAVSFFLMAQIAEARSMRCSIVEVKVVVSNGTTTQHRIAKQLKQDQIIVDMANGKVFHPYFGNEHYQIIDVFDGGSIQSSFKVMGRSGISKYHRDESINFQNTTFMQIFTFVPGSEKPFVTMVADSIATGTCK